MFVPGVEDFGDLLTHEFPGVDFLKGGREFKADFTASVRPLAS
jgi:hypothetical protein